MTAKRPDPFEPTGLQDTIRLSADGIRKVLGDLETRVMLVMWRLSEPASARVVHERVAEDHAVALHTVITVLNKLVTKRLLRRAKSADVFRYEPVLSQDEFIDRASRRAVEGILSLAPKAVAASFVDVLAEQDPERLAELMERIRARLGEADEERRDS